MVKILQKSCRDFDGGYTMAGMVGYGESFIARDPAGIRPAYYQAASRMRRVRLVFFCYCKACPKQARTDG